LLVVMLSLKTTLISLICLSPYLMWFEFEMPPQDQCKLNVL
jgi:flagellar assembly factor FliW